MKIIFKYGGNEIKVDLQKSTLGFTIIVSDNGNTLTKENKDKIFEKFYRILNEHDRGHNPVMVGESFWAFRQYYHAAFENDPDDFVLRDGKKIRKGLFSYLNIFAKPSDQQVIIIMIFHIIKFYLSGWLRVDARNGPS